MRGEHVRDDEQTDSEEDVITQRGKKLRSGMQFTRRERIESARCRKLSSLKEKETKGDVRRKRHLDTTRRGWWWLWGLVLSRLRLSDISGSPKRGGKMIYNELLDSFMRTIVQLLLKTKLRQSGFDIIAV